MASASPGVTRKQSNGLFTDSDTTNKKGRNFKVVVRVRPVIEREQTFQECVSVNSNHAITIKKVRSLTCSDCTHVINTHITVCNRERTPHAHAVHT